MVQGGEAVKAEDLWTKAERDSICDIVLMSSTWPNELHRAKKTFNASLQMLREARATIHSDFCSDRHHGECEKIMAFLVEVDR
jgi:hypothetical protein